MSNYLSERQINALKAFARLCKHVKQWEKRPVTENPIVLTMPEFHTRVQTNVGYQGYLALVACWAPEKAGKFDFSEEQRSAVWLRLSQMDAGVFNPYKAWLLEQLEIEGSQPSKDVQTGLQLYQTRVAKSKHQCPLHSKSRLGAGGVHSCRPDMVDTATATAISESDKKVVGL